MKKFRKKVIGALLVCFSFLLVLGFYACKKEEKLLTFLTPQITYRVGDNIDAFEMVERKENVEYTFSYQKEDEDAHSFIGRTFCVASSGTYTLHCQATQGELVETGDATFEVLDITPTVTAQSSNITFDLYQEINVWALMAMNGIVVNSDTEYNTIVDYITYYANDSYTNGEVIQFYDGTKAMHEFDLAEYRKKTIKFDKEGIYVFHVYVENAGGRSETQFKVFCTEDLSKLELLTDNNITFNTKTYMAQWDAIEGAHEYKVKIGTSAFYTKELSMDMSDSIYKEFMYFDLVVLPLDENGDKIGKKVILENIVVSPEGYEGIVLSEGAKLDKKTESVVLVGDAVTNGNINYWYEYENNYIAFSGKYGVGTYVEATFTGNNLPYVCFFSNDISSNMTNSDGGTGLLLMNGIGSNTYQDRLRVYGMDRLAESYWDSSSKMLRSMDTYSSAISQDGLSMNLGAEYKYVVGTFENTAGYLTLDIELYKKTPQGNWEIAWQVCESTFLSADEIVPGNIIMWAGVKGIEENTEFAFVRPYQKTITDEMKNESIAFGSKNQDGTITLEAAPCNPSNGYGSIREAKNGYVAYKGDYGVGTYVETMFTSSTEAIASVPTSFGCANLPQIILLADTTKGGTTTDSGKGILLSSGIGFWDASSYRNANSSLSIYGLDRLNNDVGTKLSISTFPLLTQIGLRNAPQGDTYKYIVGTFYNLNNELCIDITLQKEDNGSWIELYNADGVSYTNIILNTKWTEDEINAAGLGKNVIIMAENKSEVWKPTTTFKLNGFTTKEAKPVNPLPEYVPPYMSNGAAFNADGTVTLAGAGFFGAGGSQELWNAQFGYVGYNGNYGIGSTLSFTFTGMNIPDVILFAGALDGYKSSYAGAGMLLTAGLAPCNNGATSSDVGMDGEWSDFRVYGMNRVAQTTGYDWVVDDGYDGYDGNLNATLYGTTGGSTYADYPLLTQAGLSADTSGDEYKYEITTRLNSENKIVVVVSLYRKSGNNFVEIENAKGATYTNLEITTTFMESDIKGTNVIFQAPGVKAKWAQSITFAYAEPQKGNAGE